MKSNLKQFDIGLGLPPIYYRPETYDEAIIQEVLIRRDYVFPDIPDVKRIFDIGANIGITTVVMAQQFPDAIIHCFEPEPENFEILKMNVEHLGDRIVLANAALLNYSGQANLYRPQLPFNHGGFSTVMVPEGEGGPQTVKALSTRQYVQVVGHPDIIKIDCEGAEYQILLDVPDMSKVQWVVGELHDCHSWELLAHLSKTHEVSTIRRQGQGNWPFHAGLRAKFHKYSPPRQVSDLVNKE